MDDDKKMKGTGPVAVAICEAFGLDSRNCRGLVFTMKAGEMVSLDAEMWVGEGQARKLGTILKQFHLVPAEPTQDITTIADEAVRKQAAA